MRGRRLAGFIAAWAFSAGVWADPEAPYNVPEKPPWQESKAQLPAYPKEENLIEFPIGSRSQNRFSIDESSLDVGEDGVVRYVLVIRTPGGATNVTFEGIRCSERTYKRYAIGRQDKTWYQLPVSDWTLIENKSINRHHAVLNRELFCPFGSPIASAQEGRAALRRAPTR